MIGAVNVANRIPVTIQHNRRSGEFLFQLLDLLRQLADLCPQIIGTSFFGSSTRGMTSYPIHQHGDNRHDRQHLLAPVTINSSDPSLSQVQVERLNAKTGSVVALKQVYPMPQVWTENLDLVFCGPKSNTVGNGEAVLYVIAIFNKQGCWQLVVLWQASRKYCEQSLESDLYRKRER
jgi:hypothetical protein